MPPRYQRKSKLLRRDLQSPRQQQEEEEQLYVPQALLGAGALVGGAGAAMHYGISDENAKSLKNFAGLSKRDYGVDEAGLLQRIKDYSQYGHEATKVDPFGVDIVDVMKATRTTPTATAMGESWEPGPKGSAQHYTEFRKSPLDAYRQRISELYWSPFGRGSGGKARTEREFENLAEAFGGEKTYKDVLAKKFNSSIPEGYQVEAFESDFDRALEAYRKANTDFKDQVPIGEFDEWLKSQDEFKNFAQAKRHVDLHSGLVTYADEPASRYAKPLINPWMAVRDYAPWIGGAAALGGAGMLLHQYLTTPEEEEGEEEAEERLKAEAVANARSGRSPLKRGRRKAAAFLDGAWRILDGPFSKEAVALGTSREAFCLGFVETLEDALR